MHPEARQAIKDLRASLTITNTIMKSPRREPMDTRKLQDAETQAEGALRKLEELVLREQQVIAEDQAKKLVNSEAFGVPSEQVPSSDPISNFPDVTAADLIPDARPL